MEKKVASTVSVTYCPYKIKRIWFLKARFKEGLSIILPVPEGGLQESQRGPFTRARSDRTRGNGFKLKEGRFRLDIKEKFFTVSVVRHWNSLPREVVDAPSLAVFKARLDVALSKLV